MFKVEYDQLPQTIKNSYSVGEIDRIESPGPDAFIVYHQEGFDKWIFSNWDNQFIILWGEKYDN